MLQPDNILTSGLGNDDAGIGGAGQRFVGTESVLGVAQAGANARCIAECRMGGVILHPPAMNPHFPWRAGAFQIAGTRLGTHFTGRIFSVPVDNPPPMKFGRATRRRAR